jgi:hypothetical protein
MSLLRVLHVCAPKDTFAWALSRQERGLGLVSDVIRLYGDDEGIDIDLATGDRGAREIAARSQAGLRAALDYDVLHFHGYSLFTWDDLDGHPPPLLDVEAAKAMGRRVVFTLPDTEALKRLDSVLPLADAIFYLEPSLGPRLARGISLAGLGLDPIRIAEVVIGAYRDDGRP